MGAYLPEYNVCTIWHLKDIAAGKRRLILAKDARHIHVPYFDELSIEKMLQFAEDYSEVARVFPTELRELEKLHRQYISNVIHTIVGEPFRSCIERVMAERV